VISVTALGSSLVASRDLLWFQSASEACAAQPPASTATTTAATGSRATPMALSLTGKAAASEMFRLCVRTPVVGSLVFAQRVVDLGAVQIQVVQLDLQTASVAAAASQQVVLTYNSNTLPVGSMVAFVQTSSPCSAVGDGIVSQTPAVPVTLDGAAGSTARTLVFNFEGKKSSQQYRLRALLPGSVRWLDYSSDAVAITGLSVRPGIAERSRSASPPAAWCRAQSMACASVALGSPTSPPRRPPRLRRPRPACTPSTSPASSWRCSPASCASSPSPAPPPPSPAHA
jgi:hypothetical protein